MTAIGTKGSPIVVTLLFWIGPALLAVLHLLVRNVFGQARWVLDGNTTLPGREPG